MHSWKYTHKIKIVVGIVVMNVIFGGGGGSKENKFNRNTE